MFSINQGTKSARKAQAENDRHFPATWNNLFAGVVVYLNADGLFRGRNEAIISDLSREEFERVQESIGRPLTQTFFVRTYNHENIGRNIMVNNRCIHFALIVAMSLLSFASAADFSKETVNYNSVKQALGDIIDHEFTVSTNEISCPNEINIIIKVAP